MNTKNLKAYAPKARKQFIEAVKKRAAHFGIYEDRVEDVRIEGGAAIIEGRAFTRKEGEQRKRLESKLAERGYDMFTREIAYTWFNRLAALRYMEIHDYFDHGFRVLSHPTNQGGLPEILNHASDVAESLNLDKDHIIELQLAGDKEEELYRELLLGQCHQLAKIMPQIFKGLAFEAIDDATELLLPNNLTKTDSILKGLINDIPEEDWQEIEVIGWLYQFYISEHKDAVIGKVVRSEDIPAATQLFTPNWIVKYLVQNSVGRQWLSTYPDSGLKGKMEYYIEPAEQSEEVIEQLKAITPTSIDPEEIKVLDPACGSGHILVEVYEVLREIYLERGYRLREIPELILTKNIYGLDIDDRAAQLAGFALMMKAREDDRRIFQRVEDGEVTLNVYSLQSTEHFDIHKTWNALDLEGKHQSGTTAGLFDEVVQPSDFAYNEKSDKTIPAQAGIYADYYQLLQILKTAFLQAKTFGSLIHIDNQHLKKLIALKGLLQAKEKGLDPAAKQAALEVLPVINQAICLSNRYNSIVANPPYMGGKGMNSELKDFLKLNYSNYKSDLFSAFVAMCSQLGNLYADIGIMSPNVWMYLYNHRELRKYILEQCRVSSLIELPLSGFKGATVQICAYLFSNHKCIGFNSKYIRLVNEKGGDLEMAEKTKQAILGNNKLLYQACSDKYRKIPDYPIAYWVSDEIIDSFDKGIPFGDFSEAKRGIATGNNEKFIRYWFEVDNNAIGVRLSRDKAFESNYKWFPHNKGGDNRKWYGNNELVVKWHNNGFEIKNQPCKPSGDRGWRNTNEELCFQTGITWGGLTSSDLSFRFSDYGALFDTNKGPMMFPEDVYLILGFLNSPVALEYCNLLNPTVSFQNADINRIPFLRDRLNSQEDKISSLSQIAVALSKEDWVSFESNWEFSIFPLLGSKSKKVSESLELRLELDEKRAEVLFSTQNEINTLFCESMGISPPKLKKSAIQLLTNSNYIFNNLSIEESKNRMKSSYLASLLSYALGCMMGRYSLDREGLVYAHSCNEGFKELVAEGAFQTFPADDDGIVPLASEEWLFDDDATTRFKEFVKTIWSDEHLPENLEFVAESLCLHALKPKKGESAMDTVRRYFSTQFFKDHCKTYKKRPIYWLFSSGKEKAFECLVYLHRYNEGTLSRMRTEYVTPLMGKYEAQHTLLSEQQLQATGTEARGIEKDLKSLEKKQAELRTFDEQLKHYAEKRIKLDLDDGVKANYGKFGNLLADVKAIHGKAVK